MRRLSILIFMSLIVLVSGCHKKRVETVCCQASQERLHLVTFIAGHMPTRAPQLGANGAGQFSDGDVIQLSAAAGTKSILLDYTVNQTELKWSDLQGLPEANLTLSACYPKQSSVSSGRFIFSIDQSQGETADLLLAQSDEVPWGATAPITLYFRHAMHRLTIEYLSSDGSYDATALNEVKLLCSALSSCEVILNENRVEADPSATAMTYTATGNNASLLLVPQPVAGIGLKLQIADKTYEYMLPSTTESGASLTALESGKSLNIRFDIKKGGTVAPDITIRGISILGWESQDEVHGEVVVE